MERVEELPLVLLNFRFLFTYQENLNVQLLNDFLVLKELLPTLVELDRIIPIYINK